LLNDGTIKGGDALTDKEKEYVKESFQMSDNLLRANAIKDYIK
jgi:hypothetical protein